MLKTPLFIFKNLFQIFSNFLIVKKIFRNYIMKIVKEHFQKIVLRYENLIIL